MAACGSHSGSCGVRADAQPGRRPFGRPPTCPRGNAEYRDILAAAKYLQTRIDVDRDKIGIWGVSYGGTLTAQALARNSDIFKIGVDLAGDHLWGNIKGWRAYFAIGNSTTKLADLDRYVWLRLWGFLTKRQGSRGRLSPAAFAEWERRSGLAYFYSKGRRGFPPCTS